VPEPAAPVAAARSGDLRKPLVFISHLHEDVALANVIRTFMYEKSGGELTIFQSSSPVATGPAVGRNLHRELMENLWHTSVLILLYTGSERNWAYPMWECGVATQPESSETNPLVLQVGENSPPMFEDRVRINLLDQDAVYKFTRQFLTDEGFVPERGRPVTGFEPDSEPVRRAANELFEALRPLFPSGDNANVTDEWAAYPFLRLYLPLDRLDTFLAGVRDRGFGLALDECLIDHSDLFVGQMFGRREAPPHQPLRVLTEDHGSTYPNSSTAWVDALCEQIVRGVEFRFPNVPLQLMRSVNQNDLAWYAPIVTAVRRVPRFKHHEVDVYFIRFSIDGDQRVVAELQDTFRVPDTVLDDERLQAYPENPNPAGQATASERRSTSAGTLG